MERSDELATKYAPTVAGIQQFGGARARQAGQLDRQVENRANREQQRTAMEHRVSQNAIPTYPRQTSVNMWVTHRLTTTYVTSKTDT